jgi:hypothetical protein
MVLRGALLVVMILATTLAALPAVADALTPSSNLAGITKVHEKISVVLNLKGAEEFGVDPDRIKAAVRKKLKSAGVATDGAGIGTPMVTASVVGEATGGGGARYVVELVVKATIPSPFTQNRSVQAIFWRGVASGEDMMRYDPASKDLVKPTGPLDERVYASVEEVALHLASDFKKANVRK